MRIEIIHKNKKIGIDYFKLQEIDNNSRCKLYVRTDDVLQVDFTNERIFITVSYTTIDDKTWIYTELEIDLDSFRMISLGEYEGEGAVTFLNQEDNPEFDQNVIDIFLLWRRGEEFDVENSSFEERKSYPMACSLWQGRNIGVFKYKAQYVLDCSRIRDRYDFYILFAEMLLGKKAYLGSNLDAFHDSLIDFKILAQGKKIKVKFKNHKLMLTAINNTYFWGNIFEILENHRIQFILD